VTGARNNLFGLTEGVKGQWTGTKERVPLRDHRLDLKRGHLMKLPMKDRSLVEPRLARPDSRGSNDRKNGDSFANLQIYS